MVVKVYTKNGIVTVYARKVAFRTHGTYALVGNEWYCVATIMTGSLSFATVPERTCVTVTV
jgi:hypothetical protein